MRSSPRFRFKFTKLDLARLDRYKKILTFFEDAHANNYKFAVGGTADPNPSNGLFIPISLVDNPPENSKIVQEEPFGPIVPLLKWSDEADVIKRASEYALVLSLFQEMNIGGAFLDDTNLGLSAYVWGKDIDSVERIAKQIQAGSECSNPRTLSFRANWRILY